MPRINIDEFNAVDWQRLHRIVDGAVVTTPHRVQFGNTASVRGIPEEDVDDEEDIFSYNEIIKNARNSK